MRAARTARGASARMIDVEALESASAMLKASEKTVSISVRPRSRMKFAAVIYNHMVLGRVKVQADVDALLIKIHRGE